MVDDIMLIDSDLIRDPNATVSGDLEERSGDFSLGRGFAIFSLLWWLGLLILGLVAGAIFAWLGRAQLFGAVETLRSNFVHSLVTALIVWIVLPIVAVLILFTIVGIPLGISILIVLLPILLMLGLIVVGAWIGSYIIKSPTTGGAIGMTILGVIILALVSLIPFVAIITALAGMLGAGALVYRTFRRSQDRAVPAPPAPAA
jgi:MFS family permease